MTNIHVLENKISLIKGYLHILERYKRYSQEEIQKNIDLRGALERYLYLAMQAAIDLAEALIAYKELRKPSSMRESFSILHEHGLIPTEVTDTLVSMVGFRNVIAHDYANVDYGRVCKVLHQDIAKLSDFIAAIESLL